MILGTRVALQGAQGMAPRWREMPVRHARQHIEFCFRATAPSASPASFDPQTGHMLRRYTHKGVRDDSTWTRAQAWAMVGYEVMYLWTRSASSWT